MIFLYVILGILIILFFVVYFISNKVFNVAVKAKAKKAKVFDANAEHREEADRTQTDIDRKWLCEQSFEEVEITSFDGLLLFGRVLRAKESSNKWFVGVHGFSSDGLALGIIARNFHDRGYNCLLPDLRACGRSEGVYMGMGWLDSKDMLKWIDLIIKRENNAKIVLGGFSMGGATVMMTTGQELPKNVVAAIEDSGYTSVWNEFSIQLKKVFSLPTFPFLHVANAMAKRRAGYSFKEASSIEQLKKSSTPTLFIHGTKDAFVPFFMLEENYSAATCKKEKLEVEGGGHCTSVEVSPDKYWSAVDNFLDKYV